MSIDPTSLLVTGGTLAPALAATCATASLALGGALLVPRLSRALLPDPRETRLADYLPFAALHADGCTLVAQNGDLTRAFRLDGADLVTATEEEAHALFSARRTWLSQIAEKRVRARIFSIRTRIDLGRTRRHENALLASLDDAWEKSLSSSSFSTTHYVTLTTEKSAGLTALTEACDATLAALSAFGPTALTRHSGPDNPLVLFGRLASPLSRPRPRLGPGIDINEQIAADILEFRDDASGLITARHGERSRLLAVVGIKAWGDATDEQFIAELGSLSFEYTIYHHVEPMPRIKAAATLDVSFRLARTNIMRAEAADQFEAVSRLIDGNAEDSQPLCNYGLNIIVEADDEATLARHIAEIARIAARHEITVIREGAVAQAVWWSQFPTYNTLPRPWRPIAANVATLLVLQADHPGYERSPLGEGPVAYLRTAHGSPFGFVFHDVADPNNRESPGHMIVVGPTGSGKTMLTTWLGTMAMRFPELRLFLFDRFNGCEVITRMAGGNYVTFDGSSSTALNPLQIELKQRNRDFLLTWMQLLTGLNDEATIEECARLLDIAGALPQEQRNLAALARLAFAHDGEAYRRLQPWIAENQLGHVFCAPTDSLDLGNRLIGFDFTRILDPERTDALGPAVVSYIMHRTREVSSDQGAPSIFFIDETAPLLANPFFARRFQAGLQEGRKLGQIWICAFQRPNAIEESGMAQLILGQCPTQILYRNPRARAEDYAAFDLSQREWAFISGRTHQHIPRAFLLRRRSDAGAAVSVVIDADLSALRHAEIGNGLACYASGTRNVQLLNNLAGLHPDDFRDHYLKASR